MHVVPSWSNPDTQKGLEYGFCIILTVLTVGTEPAVLYLYNKVNWGFWGSKSDIGLLEMISLLSTARMTSHCHCG